MDIFYAAGLLLFGITLGLLLGEGIERHRRKGEEEERKRRREAELMLAEEYGRTLGQLERTRKHTSDIEVKETSIQQKEDV